MGVATRRDRNKRSPFVDGHTFLVRRADRRHERGLNSDLAADASRAPGSRAKAMLLDIARCRMTALNRATAQCASRGLLGQPPRARTRPPHNF